MRTSVALASAIACCLLPALSPAEPTVSIRTPAAVPTAPIAPPAATPALPSMSLAARLAALAPGFMRRIFDVFRANPRQQTATASPPAPQFEPGTAK